MNTNAKWIALTVTALILSACGKEEQSNTPSAPPPVQKQSASVPAISSAAKPAPETAAKPAADILHDTATLQAAEDALKALPKFSGKPIKVFQSIMFHRNGSIELSIQDPDNPNNIDQYKYEDGEWLPPRPVRISGNGKMADNVFDLNEIQFATAAKVAETYEAKAKEVNAIDPGTRSVHYDLIVSNGTRRWTTRNIETEREQYRIEFNKDGSLKSFKKN